MVLCVLNSVTKVFLVAGIMEYGRDTEIAKKYIYFIKFVLAHLEQSSLSQQLMQTQMYAMISLSPQ